NHGTVQGVARRGPDHRAGDARTRHCGARTSPDSPARRQNRARRKNGRPDVNRHWWMSTAAAARIVLAGCHKAQTAQAYEALPGQRRTLVVSPSASGAIEPVLPVDVKSKASGEIITMNVQTGDDVKEDQLLASIDPRIPRNSLAQA